MKDPENSGSFEKARRLQGYVVKAHVIQR